MKLKRKGKYKTQKIKEGKVCFKCGKGVLMACPCSNCKGHKKWNLFCPKCKWSNY